MIDYSSAFWRVRVFRFVRFSSVTFLVLTVIAMFFYPGGSISDPTTKGYSFFGNFFSELGYIHTKSGAANPVGAPLFFIALLMAGTGMILFFAAFPQFFQATRSGRVLSLLGTASGVTSGLCFVGVAFTPADLFLDIHFQFVYWAFRLFPLAVLFYMLVIFRTDSFPRLYGWELLGFFVLLVAYLLLLEFGPDYTTHTGNIIQATGQKIIAYASIGSVWFQATGALKLRGG